MVFRDSYKTNYPRKKIINVNSALITLKSDEVINIKEGVMYPILYKLLKDNMISNYDVVVNNRVRVYYKIEEAGLKELANLRSEFTKSVDIINRIISTK